jgi:hypothetical protein
MAFVNALKNIRTGEPGAVEEFQALYTQNEREVKVGASALRIVGTNDKAESVNKKALMTLQSKCYTFTAVDSVQVPTDIDNERASSFMGIPERQEEVPYRSKIGVENGSKSNDAEEFGRMPRCRWYRHAEAAGERSAWFHRANGVSSHMS